jgi:uncharacterized ion transporter superfamily protein YfcC
MFYRRYTISQTLLSLLIIIILMTIAVYFLPSNKEMLDKDRSEVKNWDLNGVVVDKYIDEQNHNYEILVIKDIKSNISVKNIFNNDESIFFEYVQINDTLKKEAGSLKICIKRNNKDTCINLNF